MAREAQRAKTGRNRRPPGQGSIQAVRLEADSYHRSFRKVIQYTYTRDKSNTEGVHKWDQLYLSTIQHADYGTDPANPNFLVTIQFTYGDRPDHFSDYRAGFEIRTVQRCTQIDIFAGADGRLRCAPTIWIMWTSSLTNLNCCCQTAARCFIR